MSNTCYIYQPHFKTESFRVACKNQRGSVYNYVIVTCSPQYNGVWQYNAVNCRKYPTWTNNSVDCYCVPIKDCTFVKSLDKLENPQVIKEVKKQQKKWYSSTVTNRAYEYVKKPQWML